MGHAGSLVIAKRDYMLSANRVFFLPASFFHGAARVEEWESRSTTDAFSFLTA